jgi:hypothetical protein
MYQFRKEKLDTGAWRFELDGISLIVDGYLEKNGKHQIINAESAIGVFNFKDEIYSIANRNKYYQFIEDFYKAMKEQYSFFIANNTKLKYA